ncbi:CRAL-TRIO domain-containing protein [Trametes maxima]|nr:CRAL-TRIO domain-containing protein [Trametes maxima]
MSTVLETLHVQEKLLVEAYEQNIHGTRTLQRTLIEDILPGLVDELGLDGTDEERARLWLNDLQSIFRIYRRHKFTIPFALEHTRDVLLWRLAVVPAEIPRCPSTFLKCLPLTSRDPFGRPIVVLKLAELFDYPGDVREAVIHYTELMRLNLEEMNRRRAGEGESSRPILQYVVLMDIGGISVQNVNTDLIPWHVFELVPRFPGMLAAVFVLNYSWAHAGVWNIIKRVLPTSALSRVFFPSGRELLQHLPPTAVPQDYGGELPALSELPDPLEKLIAPAPASPEKAVALTHLVPPEPLPRVPSISPTSHLNPYFGYPVSGRDALTPRLRHGRQRKRDLLRTLAGLWWGKWKHRVYRGALLAVVLLCMMVASRRRWRILRSKPQLGARGLLLAAGSR